MIGYTVYVAVGFEILSHTAVRTYDAAFLRADAFLGFNLVAFANVIYGFPLLTAVLLYAYIALPFVVAVAWLIE